MRVMKISEEKVGNGLWESNGLVTDEVTALKGQRHVPICLSSISKTAGDAI